MRALVLLGALVLVCISWVDVLTHPLGSLLVLAIYAAVVGIVAIGVSVFRSEPAPVNQRHTPVYFPPQCRCSIEPIEHEDPSTWLN